MSRLEKPPNRLGDWNFGDDPPDWLLQVYIGDFLDAAEIFPEPKREWLMRALVAEVAPQLKKYVMENIEAAIEQIFRPHEGFADSYFELRGDGLRAMIFDDEFQFIIPWDDLLGPNTRERLAAFRLSFDRWMQECEAEITREEALEAKAK